MSRGSPPPEVGPSRSPRVTTLRGTSPPQRPAQVRDLLRRPDSPRSKDVLDLKVRQHPEKGPYVEVCCPAGGLGFRAQAEQVILWKPPWNLDAGVWDC